MKARCFHFCGLVQLAFCGERNDNTRKRCSKLLKYITGALMVCMLALPALSQSGPVPANFFSMGVNTFANINCNVITPVTNCSTPYKFPTFNNNGVTTNMFYGYRLWDQFCANCPGASSTNGNIGKWAFMESTRGMFQFGGLDEILAIAASRNFDVLFAGGHLPTVPPFVVGPETGPPNDISDGTENCMGVTVPDGNGHTTVYTVPTAAGNTATSNCFWKEFLTGLAHHVQDWNSSHSANVQFYYECWNEPNGGFWGGSISQMVQMCKDGRNVVHAIDSTCAGRKCFISPAPQGRCSGAWLGGGTCDAVPYGSFFGTTSTDGTTTGKQTVDAVAFHPYVSTTGNDPNEVVRAPECVALITNGTIEPNCGLSSSNPSVKSAMVAASLGNLPLWATEHYWLGPDAVQPNFMYNNAGSPCTSNSDPSCQATETGFVARDHLLLWANGVSRSWWYNYDGQTTGTLWDAANGLRQDGIGFEQLQSWISGATLTNSPCTIVNSNVQYCDFTKPSPAGYTARAVWFLTQSGATTPCPTTVCTSSYTDWRNLSGVTTQGIPSSVSGSPILLEHTSQVTILRPTANQPIQNGGFSNPTNAYDANDVTYSSAQAAWNAKDRAVDTFWQGFSAASGTPTAINLKVHSVVNLTGPTPNTDATAYIEYLVGSTWTRIYTVHASRANVTDVISLPTNLDLTTLKVHGFVDFTNNTPSGAGITLAIYEIWVEVTN